MQDMMNIVKKFSDDAMESAKKIGDLNMKTFEELTGKQTDLVKSFVEMSTKNAEAATKVKDMGELASLQQETVTAYNDKLITSMREATDVLTAARDELVSIMEEAAKNNQANAEDAVEAGKQVAADAAEKTVEAVEKAATEVAAMTQEATAKTVEATKKAASQAKVA